MGISAGWLELLPAKKLALKLILRELAGIDGPIPSNSTALYDTELSREVLENKWFAEEGMDIHHTDIL